MIDKGFTIINRLKRDHLPFNSAHVGVAARVFDGIVHDTRENGYQQYQEHHEDKHQLTENEHVAGVTTVRGLYITLNSVY